MGFLRAQPARGLFGGRRPCLRGEHGLGAAHCRALLLASGHCPEYILWQDRRPSNRRKPLERIYAVFLLVFLGEIACRALFGLEPDMLAAGEDGFIAGLTVLAVDFILYAFENFRKR
ncbi:MAG: hypothetical protein AB7V14_12680 [Kiritimatiellia bacterium]